MLSVVLDTNVVVRALLAPDSRMGAEIRRLTRFEVYASRPLVEEIAEVTRRPHIVARLGRYGRVAERDAILAAIHTWRRVEPRVRVTVCRDPDDNMLLECALAAQADFLVTGDEDLLLLREFESTRIVTPAQFMEVLDHTATN